MTICSAAHLKTSCVELFVFVLHLDCCSCHATLFCTLIFFASLESLVLAALDNTWSRFFFPSRISILNLVYLCYFNSQICDFWFYSITLILLSNSIGLIQFRFFKGELYPISHNDLIMHWFSRANLCGVPLVIVYSFGSKNNRAKTKLCALSATFYRIPIRYSKRELWKFYQGHIFEMNFRSLQKPWLPQIISPKILRTLIWNFYCSFLRILDRKSVV